ncbi:hypothetical protein ACHAPT_012916 [Fusarium lateritium]
MPEFPSVVLVLLSALAAVSVASPPQDGQHPTDTLRVVARQNDNPLSAIEPHTVAGQTIQGKATEPWTPPTLTVYTSVTVPTGRPTLKPEPSCRPASNNGVLHYKKTEPGKAIKNGIKLRILCVGDSITAGYGDPDWNGYREQLGKDLSKNKVVWAGTRKNPNTKMVDGYHAGFPGKTIQFIANNVGPSLKHRPNVILLAAGTNDMSSNEDTSLQGNNPKRAANRLGNLIDKMAEACPDAVILVSVIINTCDNANHIKQHERTERFQKLIPGIVQQRRQEGKHVVAVDFSNWGGNLSDCVHPTENAYDLMGDMWYSFLTQVNEDWIQAPQGADPVRGNN